MAIISISGKIHSGKDTLATMLQFLFYCQRYKQEARFEGWEAWDSDQNKGNLAYNALWSIVRFGDKVKQVAGVILGDPSFAKMWESDRAWREVVLPGWAMTRREFLQKLATDAVRNQLHEDAWVLSTFANYHRDPARWQQVFSALGGGIVVPDPRNIELSTRMQTEANAQARAEADSMVPLPRWIMPDTRFYNELFGCRDRKGFIIRIDRFKKGDKVYWKDPDTDEHQEGANSGVYTITGMYDHVCEIVNDVGVTYDVPFHEIRLHIPDSHESETELDWLDSELIDIYVVNNGTLEDLFNKAKDIFKFYGEYAKLI